MSQKHLYHYRGLKQFCRLIVPDMLLFSQDQILDACCAQKKRVFHRFPVHSNDFCIK